MARKSKISVIPADKSIPHHRNALFFEGIPADTKAAFKAACYRRGEYMRDVIIQFMRDYAAR